MLAELLVFRALRDKHGLARIRIPYTCGSRLSTDTIRFLHAIGVKVRELYSDSEATQRSFADG
jgi:long-chain acyl-CoA synthetase